MSSIAVNSPRTPVTEGSGGKALATTPNVCKMPGPPAPFVPTPLPNLGTSSDRLQNATKSVLFEGRTVAIKGSFFMSQPSGDVASTGTGGGVISAKTQGKTEWLAPGSLDVKAEGKNIQLLGDAMGNNGGSPVNAATMKELQDVIGAPDAAALCAAVCAHLNTGRGQSRRAEEDFLKNQQGTGWTNQHAFDLKTAPGQQCIPDLYNTLTGTIVELKLCPNEPYTPNQLRFQEELARGKHRPHRKRDFVKVTPQTCGCAD